MATLRRSLVVALALVVFESSSSGTETVTAGETTDGAVTDLRGASPSQPKRKKRRWKVAGKWHFGSKKATVEHWHILQ